ncbi:MAG: hypothetical protein ACE37F_26275 [Nannocystaceae bacterium]|nr:hypothetical protein [bacterium]
MKRVGVLVLSCGLQLGCKVSFGSDPVAKPPGGEGGESSPAGASEGAAPIRTSPDASPSTPERTSPPRSKPASWSEALAALDPEAEGAFEAVTTVFVQTHPQGSTRASTVRLDLAQLIDFVAKTADVADARVRADPALRAAACESAGYGCGETTPQAKAEIVALQARGVRFNYAGEGTMQVGVDHAAIATALEGGLDAPSRAYLAAQHTSALFRQRFDEGGYGGTPALAVDALLAAEALAADPGPYADIAPEAAASTREAYLRLCDAGEFETPACTVSKAERASYTGFAAAHPSSPSAPAVEAFVAAMRKRRWKATAAKLDAVVAKALATEPTS